MTTVDAVSTEQSEQVVDAQTKWRVLLLLSLAELLGMAVWFSASAVVPALTAAWTLSESGRAWLTMSVQIGFVSTGSHTCALGRLELGLCLLGVGTHGRHLGDDHPAPLARSHPAGRRQALAYSGRTPTLS